MRERTILLSHPVKKFYEKIIRKKQEIEFPVFKSNFYGPWNTWSVSIEVEFPKQLLWGKSRMK